ncbi:MAG: hypothetical protein LBV58_00735 [Acholeplasmatales bacterium]|jgi:electron transport complex protein RnfA|nr:hypothetical protein [Acholeplasmatales bacterium]
MEYLGILIGAILVNNVILMQFLGLCSFFGVSDKMKSVTGMSLAVIAVIFFSVVVTYPIYVFILLPLKIGYLDTIVFALVIAAIVQLTELTVKKLSKSLYRSLGIYLPLIATNCAVLGVTLTLVHSNPIPNYLEAITLGIGTALGYALVIIAFTAIKLKLNSNDVPKAFKGLPIAFVTTALMALAFMGLSGLL